MKKLVVILFLLISLVACSTSSDFISGSEAKKLVEDQKAIILDVRTASEYNDNHIENAINVPLADLQANDFSLVKDKEATYIVYCRSGNRSTSAIKILENEGYSNLYNLGGIDNYNK